MRTKADSSLFIKEEGGKKLRVALYLNSGLVASTDSDMLENFMTCLKNESKITEKEANYFLGFEIKWRENGSIKVCYSNGKQQRINLVDVWYVSSITKNFFSIITTQDLHLKLVI